MLQHSVAAHLANKLHHCLEYIQHSDMVSWHFRLMHLYCGCILKEDIIGSVTGRGLFLFIRKRIGLEGCYLSTPGFAAATFEAFWLTFLVLMEIFLVLMRKQKFSHIGHFCRYHPNGDTSWYRVVSRLMPIYWVHFKKLAMHMVTQCWRHLLDYVVITPKW